MIHKHNVNCPTIIMIGMRATATVLIMASMAATVQASNFTTISLAGVANDQLGLLFSPSTYPTGLPTTLGGVPFDIPASGNNIFNSDIAANHGSGRVTVSLPVNLSGVIAVDTLIDTGWGQTGPTSLASLTFTFSDASTFVEPLIGNQDIRDHFSGAFTNSINDTTTVNVFTVHEDGHAGAGDYRIDKQFIDLSTFANKTLDIRHVDGYGGL
jgi:hypothetical protein